MVKFFLSIALLTATLYSHAQFTPGVSLYTQKIDDPAAAYFTPSDRTDASTQLQTAIDQLKKDRNFGILFIPEGTYTISKTIYIPAAIRLIGYGSHRPLIILKKNAPGFQQEDPKDKGKAAYMFWFTSSSPDSTGIVHDAGAGTFYSALSNIDLKIDDGNPAAVALRTHFAQHSFVAHCNIDIGKGKAGLFDIGNMIEDVKFFGGQYGIYTTKASPGWQFMMLDTYFEGQRQTAIKTQEAGFTIIRMQVKNTPSVIQVAPNYWEKLFLGDCRFENISGPALTLSDEGNAHMQLNIRNLVCRNTPVLIHYPQADTTTKAPAPIYKVQRLVYGLRMDDLDKDAKYRADIDITALKTMPAPTPSDIPALPAVKDWVNLRTLGAAGDGITDDTKAIQKAIDEHPFIYIPQGSYRITATIHLKPNTILIGLHPMATHFALKEDAPFFGGFGPPRAMIESPRGGTNILTGIGLYTAENNFGAVACKWQAGESSMIDDVKFIGGHGTMRPGPKVPWQWENQQATRPYDGSAGQTWDTQYWSCWVTNNGGGIFKNIWSASTFATAGFYASNTSTRGRIYALSVEHHVRNEVRFNNVANWQVYALQLEEESRESSECQPMEMQSCHDMSFANLYMFRVIRVKVPYPYSIRTWDCRNVELLNVHNYSQIKYTTDNPLYDINTNTEVRPTEFARLFISGATPTIAGATASPARAETPTGPARILAKGFEFALGSCHDSKGNIYFAEQRMKRIYKWSASTQSLQLLADFPWEPLSLACDAKDNLLVVFRYNPQPGFQVNGRQESFQNPPDAGGTSFSGWGNSGFATFVYSIDPNRPDETIKKLDIVPMGSIDNIYKALYPSNRWRDFHDFNQVSIQRNDSCWLAPDGKTIIPICYDLARSCALVEAFPGHPLYAVDEYDKRTVKCQVDTKGYLSDLKYFAEKGEFSAVPDQQGNVWIADGDIYKYDANGVLQQLIHTPERPSTLTIHNGAVYFTGRTAFYRVFTSPRPNTTKVLVVGSIDRYHYPMVKASGPLFQKLAAEYNLDIDVTCDLSALTEDNLAKYQVLIQLHQAPFELTDQQQYAIQQFITKGHGFIGLHAAGLTGAQFTRPGHTYWQWYEQLMGNAVYSPHPPLQQGTVVVEDHDHPVTRHLPGSFSIRDEWYEFEKSPRENVHVLATADETTYKPAHPMGDHPIIWTNPQYDRVLYIGIGHDTSICTDTNFTTLLKDALLWAASKTPDKEQRNIDESLAQPITILANQVAYNMEAPKTAIVRSKAPLPDHTTFTLVDARTLQTAYTGAVQRSEQVAEWGQAWFSRIDFSGFHTPGYYRINVRDAVSPSFQLDNNALTRIAIPAITQFFYHQRASSPEEREADRHVKLFGSDKTVDLTGGWCDASGDVSKYFSHLAYTNFMSPQQIPMVDWSMINTVEKLPGLLEQTSCKQALTAEALYGADYIMRSLSPEGYFYMTVFTYFNKDPNARRVVGLLANSKTTTDYQCAWREGGGMAIAALARIAGWRRDGAFTSEEYLAAAERAFTHLQQFSTKYADDGKDNVIDDYCALMAATELWIATGKEVYKVEARKRAGNLQSRLSPTGYFIANDADRPFWHAADAGLPIMALARYLYIETDTTHRRQALATIKKAIDYNLTITQEVKNPFGYPRQSFLYKGKVTNGFFIPHENESGWWWQGEDARLGSLAAAMLVGGRLVYPAEGPLGVRQDIAGYASNLVSWVLGSNPYNICMMYGYGKNNVPYMASMYGHGSGRGGISNGISGKNADGSGIDFKMEDNGNEWRWSEQWIPHSGWFLQAVTAMASE
ncbi:MAG TPA: ThuA domain-containing protein [Puia sp.]|nr:ThuA domain-containing protein [Puia sp.]